MLYLIAILTAFCGGLLGRAFNFRSGWHRLCAFFVPVTLAVAFMHMPTLMEVLRTGLPPLRWETLRHWRSLQVVIILSAVSLTSMGWLCSYCIQSIFED